MVATLVQVMRENQTLLVWGEVCSRRYHSWYLHQSRPACILTGWRCCSGDSPGHCGHCQNYTLINGMDTKDQLHLRHESSPHPQAPNKLTFGDGAARESMSSISTAEMPADLHPLAKLFRFNIWVPTSFLLEVHITRDCSFPPPLPVHH